MLLVLRARIASLYVIGSLVVGVLWLAGAAMLLHVKVNFCNFVAYPITFGIGVDYAVNVMTRYVQDGERDVTGRGPLDRRRRGPLLDDDDHRLLVPAAGEEPRALPLRGDGGAGRGRLPHGRGRRAAGPARRPPPE